MTLHREKLFSVLIVCVLCWCFLSCSVSEKNTNESQRFCFGTVCNIKIYGRIKNSEDIFEQVWNRMYQIENTISCKIDTSEVSKINSGYLSELSSEVKFLLDTGNCFSSLTDGSFSPYIKAVSDLWGIGTENAHIPESSEIKKALSEKKIDFGALGKGYASDVAKEILVENGVTSAVINFGGNVCCIGSKPDGSDFVIGIQDPDSERGIYYETVKISNGCVVTSGDYERFFEQNGVRYCHIIDGNTGYPVRNGVRAVTVIGESGLICDALSTSCFLLGEERSKLLLEWYPTYKVIFQCEN